MEYSLTDCTMRSIHSLLAVCILCMLGHQARAAHTAGDVCAETIVNSCDPEIVGSDTSTAQLVSILRTEAGKWAQQRKREGVGSADT